MSEDIDLTIEEAKELMADAEPAEIVHCADCAAPYENPFSRQPLRVLWWFDDRLHRAHKHVWFHQRLCDFLDRMLMRGV